MTRTAGPFPPKPGWLLRWAKQGSALMTRSADALIIMAITIAAVGFAVGSMEAMLFDLTGSRALVETLPSVIATPIAAQGVLMAMHALHVADGGARLSWQRQFSDGSDVILSSTALSLIFAAFGILVWLPGQLTGSLLPAPQEGHGLFAALKLGTNELALAFIPVMCVHPFALAAVVLPGLDVASIRANNHQLIMKARKFHFRCLLAMIGMTMIIKLLPVFVHIPAVLLMVAWSFVGGREVVAGDDQNGKPQTAAGRKPVIDGV